MLINDQLHVFHHEYMLILYDDVLDHIYVLIQDKINQSMDHQVQYIPKKKRIYYTKIGLWIERVLSSILSSEAPPVMYSFWASDYVFAPPP
jgi:hypothetical protein